MNDLISRKALLKALSKRDISRLYLVDSFKELVRELEGVHFTDVDKMGKE